VTVVLVLVLVSAIAVGVWDLLSRESRGLFRAALTCEGGLLLGVFLQLFLPGGFLVGAAAGFLAGIVAFRRWARDRVSSVHSLAAPQADDSLLLLELHDHLDSLDSDLRPAYRVAGGLALVLLAAIAASMLVMGLLDETWSFLPIGSLGLFLPLAHLMRILSERDERRALEEAIAEPRQLQGPPS